MIPKSLKNGPTSGLPAQKMLTGTVGLGTHSRPGFQGAGSPNGEGLAITTENGSGMRLQKISHLPTLLASHCCTGQASTWSRAGTEAYWTAHQEVGSPALPLAQGHAMGGDPLSSG